MNLTYTNGYIEITVMITMVQKNAWEGEISNKTSNIIPRGNSTTANCM
jgi:hypothetical protein